VSRRRRITEDRMRLLEWFGEHPTGSLAIAAQALGLDITVVEAFLSDLVDAGRIERARVQ